MRATASGRFVLVWFLILCCLAAGGCATSHPKPIPTVSDVTEFPGYENQYLLYVLSSPHPRLYVEVDAVSGCEPKDATLKKLHDFLAAYCNKPGGIDVVRSDVIPKIAAIGIPPEALARRYLDGPPTNSSAPAPAFMYFLFYDSALEEKPAVHTSSHGSQATAPRHHPRVTNPHTDFLPYPIVYINTRYGPKFAVDEVVLHEAGHMLGLANRTNDASGLHCLEPNCLMNKFLAVHISRLLTGRDPILQKQLCSHCVAQLAAEAKAPPSDKLRYVGPVLVRSEDGYEVLSLPNYVKLILGPMNDADCRDFAKDVRAETSSSPNETRVSWLVKDDAGREMAKTRESIKRAEMDPYDLAQFAASRAALTQSGDGRYFAGDSFADVVKYCHEAIRQHAEDDWCHNELAWIEATCPDASVRDGKAAVLDATKACELTEWKYWNWIDTLAAAYAEAGDFKRAAEFEQQALRTGSAPQSDQKGMRDRLSLYQQSRPYRETN